MGYGLPAGISEGSETKYEEATGGTDGQVLSAAIWRCQTFTPSVTHKVTKVILVMNRGTLEAAKPVTVSLRATDGLGKPTGADIDSDSILAGTIPVSATAMTFTFALTPTVTATTKYAIVVGFGGTGDGGFTAEIHGSVYAGGSDGYSLDSGVTWDLVAGSDLMFEEHGKTLGVSGGSPSFRKFNYRSGGV